MEDKITEIKKILESTLEITSLLISILWLAPKKAYFTNYWFSRTVIAQQNMA